MSSSSSNTSAYTLATNLTLYQPECPLGLTGTGCQHASCNTTLTPATKRVQRQDKSTCSSCPDGFGGSVNCLICQNPNACQAAQSAAGFTPPGSNTASLNAFSGIAAANNTAVCINTPRAITTTAIQCDMNQSTLAGIFGNGFQLTAIKTAAVNSPSDFDTVGLAPYNAPNGTYTSQIWLNGTLQWGCQATQCSSTNSTNPADRPAGAAPNSVTDIWSCSNLQCACVPGSTVCGGSTFDLTPVIAGLNGDTTFACEYPADEADASRAKMNCRFKGPAFNTVLGADGLPLINCQAGSCLTQTELSNYWTGGVGNTAQETSGSNLSGGVIAGLAVLGAVILALAAAILFGLFRRSKARKRPQDLPTPAMGLQWDRLSYSVRTHTTKRSSSAKKASSQSSVTSSEPREKDVEEMTALPAFGRSIAILDKSNNGHILQDVSGSIAAGSMLAILGPSGAGKTSLVDILAGRAKTGKASGAISFLPESAAPGSRRSIAFVDQEDVLPAYSTVREALGLAARLSLPENVPASERAAIVNKVLVQLGLDHIADRRIGDSRRRGVSGGEKRRISIGIALVGQPKILIMDEPLSGLDSVNAQRVIQALRSMASGPETGTSIIMTVHQPSSQIFEAFDRVMLMSKGHMLFDGMPSETAQWCEAHGEPVPLNHNPADHLLTIAFSDMANNQNATSDKSGWPASSSLTTPSPSNKPVATLLTQVQCLAHRAFLDAWRDRSGVLAHILGSVAVALITGAAFYKVNLTIAGFQNRVGSIFFLLLLITFAALSAMTILHRTRPLVVRERGNGLYTPFSWLLSHLIYDLVLLRLIPTIILVIVIYFLVGLVSDAGVFFKFFLIAVVYNFAISIYFMALAAFFEDLSIPILLGGLTIVFSLAFAGFLLNSNSIPAVLRWIRYICPMKYALEAMAIIQLPNLRIVDTVSGVKIDAPVSVFAPNLFGFDESNYFPDLLVLALGFLLFFFGLLVAAVSWRMRELR